MILLQNTHVCKLSQVFLVIDWTGNGDCPSGRASQVALVVKNLPADAGDVWDAGSTLGLGRSPEDGNCNPLQYSCLGNSMDRGFCQAAVHGAAKSGTQLNAHTHILLQEVTSTGWMKLVHGSKHLDNESCVFWNNKTFLAEFPLAFRFFFPFFLEAGGKW